MTTPKNHIISEIENLPQRQRRPRRQRRNNKRIEIVVEQERRPRRNARRNRNRRRERGSTNPYLAEFRRVESEIPLMLREALKSDIATAFMELLEHPSIPRALSFIPKTTSSYPRALQHFYKRTVFTPPVPTGVAWSRCIITMCTPLTVHSDILNTPTPAIITAGTFYLETYDPTVTTPVIPDLQFNDVWFVITWIDETVGPPFGVYYEAIVPENSLGFPFNCKTLGAGSRPLPDASALANQPSDFMNNDRRLICASCMVRPANKWSSQTVWAGNVSNTLGDLKLSSVGGYPLWMDTTPLTNKQMLDGSVGRSIYGGARDRKLIGGLSDDKGVFVTLGPWNCGSSFAYTAERDAGYMTGFESAGAGLDNLLTQHYVSTPFIEIKFTNSALMVEPKVPASYALEIDLDYYVELILDRPSWVEGTSVPYVSGGDELLEFISGHSPELRYGATDMADVDRTPSLTPINMPDQMVYHAVDEATEMKEQIEEQPMERFEAKEHKHTAFEHMIHTGLGIDNESYDFVRENVLEPVVKIGTQVLVKTIKDGLALV